MDKETIEGNKLIAIFDGWYRISSVNEGTEINWFHDEKSIKITRTTYLPTSPKGFKYHSSDEWIMPVVRKIKEIEVEDFAKKKPVMNALMDLDIKELWKAVFEFIKWYNQFNQNLKNNGK